MNNINKSISLLKKDIELLETKLEYYCNVDIEDDKISKKIIKLTQKLYLKNNTLLYLLNLLTND